MDADTLNRLTQDIKSAIAQRLPGPDAQYKMAPAGRRAQNSQAMGTTEHRQAAVMILLYPANGELHFPLIQRPDYKGVHSNQVSLPGGKIEEEDKSLEDTALRETHEEIGVHPNQITVLGALTQLYIPPSNFLVQPYLGISQSQPVFIPDQIEVSEVFSISIKELLSEERVGETKVKVAAGMRIQTPYFHLNNKVVWGATAMMLSELKQLLIGIE